MQRRVSGRFRWRYRFADGRRNGRVSTGSGSSLFKRQRDHGGRATHAARTDGLRRATWRGLELRFLTCALERSSKQPGEAGRENERVAALDGETVPADSRIDSNQRSRVHRKGGPATVTEARSSTPNHKRARGRSRVWIVYAVVAPDVEHTNIGRLSALDQRAMPSRAVADEPYPLTDHCGSYRSKRRIAVLLNRRFKHERRYVVVTSVS